MRFGGRNDRAESAPRALPSDDDVLPPEDVLPGRCVHVDLVDDRPEAGRLDVGFELVVRFVPGVLRLDSFLIYLLVHRKL